MAYTKYEPIEFENGKLVSPGKVNLETGELTMPVYSGKAPINATTLNHLEQGLVNLEDYATNSKANYKNFGTDCPDANNLQQYGSGLFEGLLSVNVPYEVWAQIEQITSSETADFALQRIYAMANNESYERKKINGVWGNWKNTSNKYSTEETIIGTWIDGKPIYRKVYFINSLPNATTNDISHNLSDVNFMRIYGIAYRDTDDFSLPLPSASSTSENNIFLGVLGDYIRITTGTDRSALSAHIILEYTKTTD